MLLELIPKEIESPIHDGDVIARCGVAGGAPG